MSVSVSEKDRGLLGQTDRNGSAWSVWWARTRAGLGFDWSTGGALEPCVRSVSPAPCAVEEGGISSAWGAVLQHHKQFISLENASPRSPSPIAANDLFHYVSCAPPNYWLMRRLSEHQRWRGRSQFSDEPRRPSSAADVPLLCVLQWANLLSVETNRASAEQAGSRGEGEEPLLKRL